MSVSNRIDTRRKSFSEAIEIYLVLTKKKKISISYSFWLKYLCLPS